MTKTIFVLNGPNLNALGKREPGIYGGKSLTDIAELCRTCGSEHEITVEFRQSNHEGELVDWIHEADEKGAGIILNPGAYGHTSIAIHDALRSVDLPTIEVHLSNVHAREEFRHKSMIAPVVNGVIVGFGPTGYLLAIKAISELI